jgi:poly-gamma-glutamate synthesis protein (capsule biosynthesis protein)
MGGLRKILIIIAVGLFIFAGFVAFSLSEDTSFGHYLRSVTHKEALPTTMIVLGDVMLDRGVEKRFDKDPVNFFTDIRSFLSSADIVIFNHEGVLPFIDRDTTNDSFQFSFRKDIVEAFAKGLPMVAGLANNHSHNFGLEGFKETKTQLSEIGINSFGSPFGDLGDVFETTWSGVPIAIYGYQDWNNRVAVLDALKAKSQIGTLDIVYAHWGEEYEQAPTETQRALAEEFIHAGADLVIGSHPHVAQPVEFISGKPVFYSLGNTIFDQYFSTQTEHGLALTLKITPRHVVITPTPIIVKDNRPMVGDLSLLNNPNLYPGFNENTQIEASF